MHKSSFSLDSIFLLKRLALVFISGKTGDCPGKHDPKKIDRMQ
jgi:hypothetical protein